MSLTGIKTHKKLPKSFNGQPQRMDPVITKMLLVGVSSFTVNAALPGVLNDVANLKRTMLSPIVGMLEENMETLINPDGKLLLQQVRALSEQPGLDTILIYYAGTGTVSTDKVFQLVCSPKVKQDGVYDFLPITLVDEALGDTKTNVVVILDCCFSQSAFTHLYLENFFIMTAASMEETTYEKEIEGETRGVFTHFLVKLLEEGMENGKAWLNLADLFAGVRALISTEQGDYLAEPKMMTTNMVSLIEIARNNRGAAVKEPKLLPTLSAFQLKNMVTEDETPKVLTQLMEAAKHNNELINDFLVLKKDFNDHENKKMIHVYLQEEAIVFGNRIIQRILSFIDRCKEEGFLGE